MVNKKEVMKDKQNIEEKVKQIILKDRKPVAASKIIEIINDEKRQTNLWKLILCLFIIVFVGYTITHELWK